MATLTTAISCLMGEVLLLSAAYKAFRPRRYWEAVTSYRRLQALPRRLRFLLGWVTPPIEFAAAVLILIPVTRLAGLVAALPVLIVFFALIESDDRSVIANCGCWGFSSVGVPRRAVLVRNLGLMILTTVAVLLLSRAGGGHAAPLTAASGGPLSTAVAAGAMLPVALLCLELPELLLIARLRPSGQSRA